MFMFYACLLKGGYKTIARKSRCNGVWVSYMCTFVVHSPKTVIHVTVKPADFEIYLRLFLSVHCVCAFECECVCVERRKKDRNCGEWKGECRLREAFVHSTNVQFQCSPGVHVSGKIPSHSLRRPHYTYMESMCMHIHGYDMHYIVLQLGGN